MYAILWPFDRLIRGLMIRCCFDQEEVIRELDRLGYHGVHEVRNYAAYIKQIYDQMHLSLPSSLMMLPPDTFRKKLINRDKDIVEWVKALELQHIVFESFEPDILRKPRERFILEILLSSNAELEKIQKVFNNYCRTNYSDEYLFNYMYYYYDVSLSSPDHFDMYLAYLIHTGRKKEAKMKEAAYNQPLTLACSLLNIPFEFDEKESLREVANVMRQIVMTQPDRGRRAIDAASVLLKAIDISRQMTEEQSFEFPQLEFDNPEDYIDSEHDKK